MARYLAVDIGINEHAAATRPRTWRFRYAPPFPTAKTTRNNSLSGATQPEAFFPGDHESVKLSYNSNSLKLLRYIRDEVHRFGITFHRQLRSKGAFKNELQEIKGIGASTVDLLLKKYKSVKKIKQLSLEELEKEIGKSKANILWRNFNVAE